MTSKLSNGASQLQSIETKGGVEGGSHADVNPSCFVADNESRSGATGQRQDSLSPAPSAPPLNDDVTEAECAPASAPSEPASVTFAAVGDVVEERRDGSESVQRGVVVWMGGEYVELRPLGCGEGALGFARLADVRRLRPMDVVEDLIVEALRLLGEDEDACASTATTPIARHLCRALDALQDASTPPDEGMTDEEDEADALAADGGLGDDTCAMCGWLADDLDVASADASARLSALRAVPALVTRIKRGDMEPACLGERRPIDVDPETWNAVAAIEAFALGLRGAR